LVRQLSGDGVASAALAAAAPAAPIGRHDAAGEDRPVRFEPLPGECEAELVEAAEPGQVWATGG
jgi:hypothetical protein